VNEYVIALFLRPSAKLYRDEKSAISQKRHKLSGGLERAEELLPIPR
jgi:hypothetical protein